MSLGFLSQSGGRVGEAEGEVGGSAAPEVCFVEPLTSTVEPQVNISHQTDGSPPQLETRSVLITSKTGLCLGMDFPFYRQLRVVLKAGSPSFTSAFSVLLFFKGPVFEPFSDLYFSVLHNQLSRQMPTKKMVSS